MTPLLTYDQVWFCVIVVLAVFSAAIAFSKR